MTEVALYIQQNLWLQYLLSFIVSLLASGSFILLLLWLLQPKLVISDKICYKEDMNGDRFYFFKIVNRSWFNAYSLEFELQKKEPYIVDKTKVNHRTTPVSLSRDKLYTIPAFKKEKGYGDHAVLIRTFGNLHEDIDVENLEYVLYVSAKHGLSNLTKVSVQTFEDSKVFHNGHFKFGKNIGVC